MNITEKCEYQERNEAKNPKNCEFREDLMESVIRKIPMNMLAIISIVCVTIHLCKFFRTKIPQSLVTKIITWYCFISFLFYAWAISGSFLWESWACTEKQNYYKIIYQIMSSTLAWIKFIIAVDIWWNFRKAALYLQLPLGFQNKKFFMYCILSAGIPLSMVYIFFNCKNDKIENFDRIYTIMDPIMRIIPLIPIGSALWYLRSTIIMNKPEFYEKFSLHSRLLAMIGAFSLVIMIIAIADIVIVMINGLDHTKKLCNPSIPKALHWIFVHLQIAGYYMEGFMIAACFTFKKGTFQSSTD